MNISLYEIYMNILNYIRKEIHPETPPPHPHTLGREDRSYTCRQALYGLAASPVQNRLFLHLTQAKNQTGCCLYANEGDLTFLGRRRAMFGVVLFETSKFSMALKMGHTVHYFILELRDPVC